MGRQIQRSSTFNARAPSSSKDTAYRETIQLATVTVSYHPGK